MCHSSVHIFILAFCLIGSAIGDYNVKITTDSPIVIGATLHFQADLFYDDERPTGTFEYIWEDNSFPAHTVRHKSTRAEDIWNVTYSNEPPGPYLIQVRVRKCYFLGICDELTSVRESFMLTDTLNGNMILSQNGNTLQHYVSNAVATTHTIELKQSDFDYVNASATSVTTYWFLDCNYLGPVDNYSWELKYNETDKEHNIEALVIADFMPITTVAPITTTTPTTTTKSTTTTTTTTPTTVSTTKYTTPTTTSKSTTQKTTTSPITTTIKPLSTTEVHPTVNNSLEKMPQSKIHTLRDGQPSSKAFPERSKRSSGDYTGVVAKVNGVLVPTNKTVIYNGTRPFVCGNNTIVPFGRNNTLGYFRRKITVKAPVQKVNVTGNNWLQQGDILSLSVVCQGSSLFNYCVHFFRGLYNVTGNETCVTPSVSEKCDFPIKRYFSDDKTHTVVIVIYNDVGKIVTPVTITVYTVKKQAQLSVIVVPVIFSLAAAVLIIFGVAYYIQNRSRFVVEVADFNFGQTYSDLEYKTFRERLRDSITNAFNRGPTPSSSEVPVWPPSRKYGSMT